MMLVRSGSGYHVEAVIEDRIMEPFLCRVERVGLFGGFMAREGAHLSPFLAGDIDAAPLYQVAGEANAEILIVQSTKAESGAEQAEKSVECVVIAAVWRCREQDQMAVLILRGLLEELKALLPALMNADAGVSFIDDDGPRAGARKAV